MYPSVRSQRYGRKIEDWLTGPAKLQKPRHLAGKTISLKDHSPKPVLFAALSIHDAESIHTFLDKGQNELGLPYNNEISRLRGPIKSTTTFLGYRVRPWSTSSRQRQTACLVSSLSTSFPNPRPKPAANGKGLLLHYEKANRKPRPKPTKRSRLHHDSSAKSWFMKTSLSLPLPRPNTPQDDGTAVRATTGLARWMETGAAASFAGSEVGVSDAVEAEKE
ncbi:hypothetical protein C8J56DRAFT_884447 [Mycena floridula]|nr:hypothetical protein C8J56DRAFT_884447 [Mycena floridula]